MSILGRAKDWAERLILESAVTYVLGRMAENLREDPMIKALRGRKTYIVGLATVAYGAWVYIVEQDTVRGTTIVLNGIGMMTLRAGVTKSGPA